MTYLCMRKLVAAIRCSLDYCRRKIVINHLDLSYDGALHFECCRLYIKHAILWNLKFRH